MARPRPIPPEHFSLRTWVRNAPWCQYFKDGCRLIVKSPLNFFIFFCCLNVVVWGAFLVLLLGNIIKLGDNDKQKLWIEIASQVLNGLFTLANVPVHPKRFLGFIRGCSIWKEDRTIRQQFTRNFLKDHTDRNLRAGSTKDEDENQLSEMLDFYRCFPEYGRDRLSDTIRSPTFSPNASPLIRYSPLAPTVASAVDSKSTAGSQSQSQSMTPNTGKPRAPGPVDDQNGVGNDSDSALHPSVDLQTTNDNSLLAATRDVVHVDIAEEDLNDLLAKETQRVAHSVVLPFLPFPLGASGTDNGSNTDSAMNQQLSSEVAVGAPDLEMGSAVDSQRSPTSIQYRRVLDRGSSYASLTRTSTKRISPRTRARTMTMSMANEAGSRTGSNRSTFVVHEDQRISHPFQHSSALPQHTQAELDSTVLPFHRDSSRSTRPDHLPPLIPMPPPLTKEQMDWIDERQTDVLFRQRRLQKAWPWYNYTIPAGIEPVDFFAHPAQQPSFLPSQSERDIKKEDTDATMGSSGNEQIGSEILFSSSPTSLIVSPSRYCLIVGLFNFNSIIQEILCGFMWGMNYHVRPGWVVGMGMALGCLAAIVPSVLIMLHEQAMSRVRVIATAEEAIQDALDDKNPSVS
ncbi:hypothetical protein BGZ99_004773 [Dissophora globulifera]|uniref:Uncharacterized protein n=1 Tax=Dissophora globulifera TaxID=979702 RepID=A0A9P6RZK1_9FUNG|nr:hypothetical protein BGZ99_004773 [Dissophora globulifera]